MSEDVKSAPTRALSCRRFLAYAVVLTGLFLIAHLAGWREYTGALSGTGPADPSQAYRGGSYVILYLGVTIAVPILLIAAALVKGLAVLTCTARKPAKPAAD